MVELDSGFEDTYDHLLSGTGPLWVRRRLTARSDRLRSLLAWNVSVPFMGTVDQCHQMLDRVHPSHHPSHLWLYEETSRRVTLEASREAKVGTQAAWCVGTRVRYRVLYVGEEVKIIPQSPGGGEAPSLTSRAMAQVSRIARLPFPVYTLDLAPWPDAEHSTMVAVSFNEAPVVGEAFAPAKVAEEVEWWYRRF